MQEIALRTRPPQAPPPTKAIRMREIADSDLQELSKFFARGFERSSPHDWLNIFDQLSRHPTLNGFARYGHLLESNDEIAGAILVISTQSRTNDGTIVRSNLSSWYVLPEFRSHAALFVSRVLRDKDVTFVNVSPAAHTIPIITAQGFVPYGKGQYFAPVNPLSGLFAGRVSEVAAGKSPSPGLDQFETELLLRHAGYGCVSLVCRTPGGIYPFVFRPRRVKTLLSAARLIYCRDVSHVVQCFGPLSRFLARKGIPPDCHRRQWSHRRLVWKARPRDDDEILQRASRASHWRSR